MTAGSLAAFSAVGKGELVSRTWIFQANPSHYDIDGALKVLDRIWWRVPQHATEVETDDVVVIWRAGREAGVIGVGRVVEPPQHHSRDDAERPFVLSPPEDDSSTEALFEVRQVEHVPKDRIAAIAEMAGHRIISAPMGTVFPLEADQWSAVHRLVGDPPAPSAVSDRSLPPPFSWDQKAKAVNPMPGGYTGYLETTRQVCEFIQNVRPTTVGLKKFISDEFELSATSTKQRQSFLRRIGLFGVDSDVCNLSSWALRWLESGDPNIVIALLHGRCRVVGEMMAELHRPLTPEDLLAVLNRKYGLSWDTLTQIDNRRGWLQSAGVITITPETEMLLTPEGEELLGHLELHLPDEPNVEGTDFPDPVADPIDAPLDGGDASTIDVERLAEEISESAVDSDDSDRFERAVTSAFEFLGFDAHWLGGPGKTDVLIDAPLAKGESYRATVDAKTTKSGQLTDQSVDWVTLVEHRTKHDADYCMLVGPKPTPGRLTDRAEQHKIAVMSAAQLAGLCRQHARTPLSLTKYRSLFECNGQVETEPIDDEVAEADRTVELAASACEVLSKRSPSMGRLTARDIWLILSSDSETDATQEDLQLLLDTLASPLVNAVEGTKEVGYMLASSPATARRRLTLLGRALDADSQ